MRHRSHGVGGGKLSEIYLYRLVFCVLLAFVSSTVLAIQLERILESFIRRVRVRLSRRRNR
ncbi:hypothetical protein WS83_25805 [Burkholderia sp. MSMB2042]|nr:hypothetical protein WS78_05740 [Burkholderia savannae]KVG41881.1 hypothetical protein WS77_15780 [Burkholderia sp. MSMB0265]KVG86466.1 hypothetical protein WS81_03345 [Burkholderia sp. MSMB2040]KVG98683.1 hypothetical protein WS82_26470 [Burkholderia sp. MSMB2041]KVG99478.1 hypothetical protein WS83_25805 [Burkholderia sp. MSMB2042]